MVSNRFNAFFVYAKDSSFFVILTVGLGQCTRHKQYAPRPGDTGSHHLA